MTSMIALKQLFIFEMAFRMILLVSGICCTQLTAQTISWSKIAGPYSGSIQLLTVNPSGNVFVWTSGRMYRSTDAGGSWQALGLSFEYGAAFLVADSANNVYAGNGAGGMYKSTDNGTSWAKSGLTGGAYSAAVLSGNRICVGGHQTVSISSDGGKSWSVSQVTTDPVTVLSAAGDNSGKIYAGLQAVNSRGGPSYGGGVYISSDSGKTWEFSGMATRTVSSIAANKERKVFILEPPASPSQHDIIESLAPKSSSWAEDDAGIPYWVNSIQALLSDNLGEAVAVTDMGIFIYRDSISTWKSITPAVSLSSITSAFYNSNGTSYAGTESDGVFSWEGSSLAWAQCGIDPVSVTSIAFNSSNNLFASTGAGVFEQRPADGLWLRVSDGLSRSTVYQIYFSASSKRLYASTADGLYVLPVGTNEWTPLTKQWTYDFVESPDGNNYAGTNIGIFKSVAGVDTWAIMQTVGIPYTRIYCVALDSAKDLLAGTSNTGAFVSTDGGSFWTQTGVSSPFIFYSVMTMGIDSRGRIFAGTDMSGAYYSDDLGVNWNSIPSISGKSVTCFLVNNPAMYFAGTSDSGAFASTDHGSNWHLSNNGLTDSSIMSLNVDQQGLLYVGTNKGLFRSTGITYIDEKNSVPSSFSLFQNYPNPFNPTTVINYQLSVNSEVTLKVYDVLGRLVNTLIEERQTVGVHSVTFNASSLSSGVYFYRLIAGSSVESKKMILIK
jgi:Secretion system C-terminal sorting domain